MKRPLRRSLLCAVVALFLLLPLGSSVRASDKSSPVKRVGMLDRYPADVARALGMTVEELRSIESARGNGTGIVFPSQDAFFQIFLIRGRRPYNETVVAKRDLGTLRLQGLKVFPRIQPALANSEGGDWFYTLDDVHGRLFLGFGTNAYPEGFLAIDAKTLVTTKLTIPTVGSYDGIRMGGIAYDPAGDRLWGIANIGNAADPSGAVSTNGLVRWPATLPRDGLLPTPEIRIVRACRGRLLPSTGGPFDTPLLRWRAPDFEAGGQLKDFYIFPCGGGGAGLSIVRIEVATAFDPQSPERVVVGPSTPWLALLDSGAGRFFIVNESANLSAWVYEADANAIIGVVALSRVGDFDIKVRGFGIDSRTGRLYGLGPDLGVFYSDTRFDPVPQALSFPRFAGRGWFRILPDTRRSRIFVLYGGKDPVERYQIFKVPAPVAPPKPEDPDRYTNQFHERADVTRANFGGGATAYGVRVLLSGGARGVAPVGPQAGAQTALGWLYNYGGSRCGPTNREVVFGGVRDTSLSLATHGASSFAIQLDPSTIADLQNPSRCDVYYRGGAFNTPPFDGVFPIAGKDANKEFDDRAGIAWRYGDANCERRGGDDVEDPNVSRFGDAKVGCSEREMSADAEVEFSRSIGQSIRFGRAETHTRVYLDPTLGLVSRAESIVTGVKIGEVSIAEIRSVAESWAKGFRKSAGSSRTVTIAGVKAPGYSCATCLDLESVRSRINDALSGRMEIRIGAPDPTLLKGTPGGYQSAVIKNDKQVSSDNALSGDSTREVPAFEILVYNDSPELGRSRQLYQFAGVATESRYGIELIPTGSGLAPLGSLGFQPPPAGSAPLPIPNGSNGSTPSTPSEGGAFPSVSEIIRGVTNGIALFVAHPREALALSSAWLLLAAPFIAARRRRLLTTALGSSVSLNDDEGRH